MKKHSLIKGTIILGLAGIFARFLGLFFRIPIQALIKDEGMGYYQMSYPLYMIFVAVASGVPIAMSKLIAEMNAKNDREGARTGIKTNTFFNAYIRLSSYYANDNVCKAYYIYIKMGS